MRPDLRLALALTALWAGLALASWGVFGSLGWAPVPAAVAAIGILSVTLCLGLAVTGRWAWAGFTGPARWRGTGWFLVPLVLTLLPLVRGIAWPEALALSLLGWALTGFAEEGVFRGILPAVLSERGPIRAALIASLLFGAVHLVNIVIRGNPAVIVSQAVGAACFGFGFAALAWRTGTIWPLVPLHMLHDLFLHLGRLPLIPVAVVQDIILLGLGIVIFWRGGGVTLPRPAPPRPAGSPSARRR
jgi:membrane protease YdiL (CAAX protease family)